MIIALDVDGVLANCAEAVYSAASRMLRRQLQKPEHWEAYDFAQALDLDEPEAEYLFSQILREDRLCWQIQLMPGAKDFVAALLAQKHEVVFVTAPWPGFRSWCVARTELLTSCWPKQDIVFTHAKQRVTCDLILEDRWQTCLDMRDRALLLTQPWNRKFDAAKAGVTRVDSYAEVLQLTSEW